MMNRLNKNERKGDSNKWLFQKKIEKLVNKDYSTKQKKMNQF